MNKSLGVFLIILSCQVLRAAEPLDKSAAQEAASEEAFDLLRKLNIPFNERTANGHKLLFDAANAESAEAVRLLMLAGAETKGWYYGKTALHMAAEQGIERAVRILIDAHVNLDAQDISHGKTPLFAALENGHFEVVYMLARAGANKSLADKKGDTPYLMALRRNNDTTKARPAKPGYAWLREYENIVELLKP
jgi:ankyrin repeat protein